ncbi:MAG: helix-turn-helix domain-containing protein, partial [Janthinobacterium lividum]
MNGIRLTICDTVSAAELRRRGRQETDRAAATRMMAIANALEGMTRAEAARSAGMERQALRDAVVRYNAERLDGLHDRPQPGARPRLNDAQMARLHQIVVDGP